MVVFGVSAGALISQAIIGTLGVFAGMLVVYKTGAIRVTPKFTRFLVGASSACASWDWSTSCWRCSMWAATWARLRSGGPIANLFSIVCIGLAAFSFLLDFDPADQAIRAGAPEKAAWGIALGLTVTLVWLYIEILWLLSIFKANDRLTRKSPRFAGGFSHVPRLSSVRFRTRHACGAYKFARWSCGTP